jgi:subtilisin-like proprotein convertase family protein
MKARTLGRVGAVLAASLLTIPSAFAGPQARNHDCSLSSFASADVPKAIPDPGTAESALVVPAGDPVAASRVTVSISHPFDSDLQLELVSPNGTAVVLAEAVGTWGHDFAGTVFDDAAATSVVSALPPFPGLLRPVEPLSSLIGAPRAGTWKLRATDLRGRYGGRIEAWRLELTSCDSDPRPVITPVGAPEAPPLPTGVPTGHVPVEGTLITVTTASDASPVEGTSLREAIETTNANPGTYTIRFDPSLAGGTIEVGSAGAGELPPLEGGVLIDGDVDGDGDPDVTIANHLAGTFTHGLNVTSSDNRLHALTLRGFHDGVVLATPRDLDLSAPRPRLTLAHNVISGLIVTGGDQGITISPRWGHDECTPACETGNVWSDTRFVGNTIEAGGDALGIVLYAIAGEAVERLTAAGNSLRLVAGSGLRGMGVDLSVGNGTGADGNRVTDALLAYNAIESERVANAINVFSGVVGGSRNVVEDLAIVGNHTDLPHPETPPDVDGAQAIALIVSDGASGNVRSKDNLLRRVRILGNVLEGQDLAGVMVVGPCCGGMPGSRISDVRIAGNVIDGAVPPHELNPWGILIAGGGGGFDVSGVVVDSNTVEQQTTEPEKEHKAYLAGGGIAVVGGLGAPSGGSVRDVVITNNRVDTDLVGIPLVGGGPSNHAEAKDALGNSVSHVQLRGNLIGRVPILATRWEPKAKGINIIGGLGGTPPSTGHWTRTEGNSVTSITLEGNLVAGVVDDVFLRSNLGEGASGNVAAFGPRPPILAVSTAGNGIGTVSSDPAGIDCGPICSHAFDDRTEVILTATASSDSVFSGWSEDCSGNATCTLSLVGDRAATARFDLVCSVPDVRRKMLAAAKRAIRRGHCATGKVTRVYSKAVRKGRVISQRPRRGARLAEGARVSLVVSRGKRR